MPYDERNTYARYQDDCEDQNQQQSSSASVCDQPVGCPCCPVGTVAVYNADGSFRGCLSPNDAEILETGVHMPPEGYVKVIVDNKYYGDLPYSQAIAYANFIENGTTTAGTIQTYNVVTPEVGSTGFYELNYALSAGVTDMIALTVDRIGITDTIGVSITNSAEGVIFEPSGTTTNIPSNDSSINVQFRWSGIITSAGVYTFTLRFATTTVVKEVAVRLTLTA